MTQAKAKAKHHDADPSSNRSAKRRAYHANQAKKKPVPARVDAAPVASAPKPEVAPAAVETRVAAGPVADAGTRASPVVSSSSCLAQIIIQYFVLGHNI